MQASEPGFCLRHSQLIGCKLKDSICRICNQPSALHKVRTSAAAPTETLERLLEQRVHIGSNIRGPGKHHAKLIAFVRE